MEKTEILSKIEILVFKNAFQDITMLQIAEKLGIKKASLYYYFASKNDIQKEVIAFSYEKYKTFIEELFHSKNKKKIIEWFFKYAKNEKNVFMQINQNGYCTNEEIINDVKEKNKEIFHIVKKSMKENFDFNKEKSFLFFSILQDICIKKCIFWECEIKENKLTEEMISIF